MPTVTSVNYPGAIDTTTEFDNDQVNQKSFTLSGAHSSVITTITTSSTIGGISAPNTILIDSELIHFTGTSGADFTGCTRGVNGTSAATHSDQTAIYHVASSELINQHRRALIAIETAVGLEGLHHVCQGRLTLTTATPYTTADVTAAGTIYFTPFLGNKVGLYDGSGTWTPVQFSEISVSVPATTVTPFDIFGYDNSGVATLETLDWTNDTTRATGLALQDGILIKSGDTTRRYLGTGRTTSVSGEIEDSTSTRFLWNLYHRWLRTLLAHDSTNLWSYATDTWRSSNANTTAGQGRVEFVVGLDYIMAEATHVRGIETSASAFVNVGIGLDSTSAPSDTAQVRTGHQGRTTRDWGMATYRGYPGIGYHYLQCLERAQASGSVSWFGDDGGASGVPRYGLVGTLEG